jgi:cytochrome b
MVAVAYCCGLTTRKVPGLEYSVNRLIEPHATSNRILVWDLPVRIFHWLLAASFAGAWLTGESEAWRSLHVTLGYTMAALVAFRIAWGFVGTRYARFTEFVKGPSAVNEYAKSIFAGRPSHFVGHNPAGAVAIVALMALTLMVVATGYAYIVLGGEWLEDTHEWAANTMLTIVAIHIVGVLAGSIVDRENLVWAMITGRKIGPSQSGIRSQRWGAALVLLGIVAGVWWLDWKEGPLTPPSARPAPYTDDED